MPAPAVSLLLPNMNNEPILDEFLTKLAAHTTYPNVEVVVVDDGSSDGSRDILRRWKREGPWSEFTLIEQENRGVAATVNRAIESSSGELLVRLDGDATIETPGWLEKMLRLQEASGQVGMVVARIIFDSGHVHSLGRHVVHPDGLHDRGTRILEPRGRRTVDSAVDRPLERQAREIDEVAEVDAALGCCTLFRREVAERVGGIDTRFSPVWIEDDDFALAIRREGWKVFYVPDVRVLHQATKRNARHGPQDRRLIQGPVVDLVALIPYRAKRLVGPWLALRKEPEWRLRLLAGHYATWREKWGFDPLNPDLEAVRRRWGGSEIMWGEDEELRAAGARIADSYRSSLAASPA
jgi:GT2 family glycosyltransferase